MAECAQFERSLEFDDALLARDLFGPENAHLQLVADKSGVDLQTRGAVLTLRSEDESRVALVANLLVQLYGLLKDGHPIYKADVAQALNSLSRQPGLQLRHLFRESVFVGTLKKSIAPKTLSQREYVEAVRTHDMTFGIGPAGTGKTYLAVAMALSHLMTRQVKRLVLIRPAVEAGEKLGFLPGDMVEKVNPYLRPLYDALHEMLDFRKVKEMLDTGVIEVAPLAFMRGRTLNDSFIIMDEAQNTTPEQMKMLLTRLGFGSKAVITGDVTQIDLPLPTYRGTGQQYRSPEQRSGLVQAERILSGVEGLAFVHFHEQDVIRHPLVQRIVQAYDQNERQS